MILPACRASSQKTFAKSEIYVYDAQHSAAVPVTADPPGGHRRLPM
jgi:hypothetical protein